MGMEHAAMDRRGTQRRIRSARIATEQIGLQMPPLWPMQAVILEIKAM